jgi:hypothetical protein
MKKNCTTGFTRTTDLLFGGDGGAGIMQITIPTPTFGELWDWRANVDKGKAIFAQKVSGARNYPGQVRSSQGFTNIVNRTNQWRQSQGRPPLAQVIVPDFQKWQVDEDAVRGYNGWVPEAGQFGLFTHEFRLQTDTTPNGVTILVVQNERRDSSGRLIADAVWIHVPLDEREGNNYVEKVRNRNPNCP